jgi:hypothetical protein
MDPWGRDRKTRRRARGNEYARADPTRFAPPALPLILVDDPHRADA